VLRCNRAIDRRVDAGRSGADMIDVIDMIRVAVHGR
jgi:hypothetical protein